jgi:HD-GYP domain-containing protein (c-di-GMP phosphodiesterase class II)
MIKEPQIPLFDLVACLSDAVDLVSPALADHHKQVAYIASCIGEEFGFPLEKQKDLVLSGALHDIGALSLAERIETLNFDFESAVQHSKLGSGLVALFEPLAPLAPIINFHHTFWNEGQGSQQVGGPVPLESHIIHLADRIAVLIDTKNEVLGQVKGICEKTLEQSGKMFHPELVEAFMSLSQKEYFWLDLKSSTIYRHLRRKARSKTIVMDLDQLNDLAMLFAKVIDFRSSFTATHSSGVSASAERIAQLCGFSERERRMMKIAGYLHDLGKLAVPREILEKPGSLTSEEFNVIRSHTFHTYRILETVEDFETINTWAAFHHERLNGKGYPFHHKGEDLSLGSRIMCVADVFTAVAEDRPYRKGMSNVETRKVLKSMAQSATLDAHIVSILESHFEEINVVRSKAQSDSREIYRQLLTVH